MSLGNGAAEHDFACATVAQHLGGAGNGWDFTATIGARGALVNFCGGAVGENPLSILNYTSSEPRRSNRAAQQCGLQTVITDEAVARAHSAEGARKNNFLLEEASGGAAHRRENTRRSAACGSCRDIGLERILSHAKPKMLGRSCDL